MTAKRTKNINFSSVHITILTSCVLALSQYLGMSMDYTPIGTPLYMAPEQLCGKFYLVSNRYALAIVVYEWLKSSTDVPTLSDLLSGYMPQPAATQGQSQQTLPVLASSDTPRKWSLKASVTCIHSIKQSSPILKRQGPVCRH